MWTERKRGDNEESTIECHYTREDLLRMEKEVVHEDDRELVREALKGQGKSTWCFRPGWANRIKAIPGWR